MVEKLYYSMGEVTEMFDVTPALIRYWCEQFDCLRPKRNAKGNRLFTPKDVELLKRIYHLLKEKKMTIEGAKRALRKRNQVEEGTDLDIELLDHLQQLRAMLVELREGLGSEEVEAPKPEVKGAVRSEAEVEEESAEEKPTAKRERKPRAPKRIKDAIERPLFPFFEQTLFDTTPLTQKIENNDADTRDN